MTSWEPPAYEDQNGAIVGYTIDTTVATTGVTYQLYSATTSLTLINLSPFTTYFIVIAASTSIGLGPYSTIFTLKTREDGNTEHIYSDISVL